MISVGRPGSTEGSATRRLPARTWWAIGAVALALHVVFLRSLWTEDALARTPVIDSAYYLELARRWLAGEIVPPDHGLLLLPPGYPMFLAPLLAVAGHHYWLILLVQAVLAAAGVVVLGRLAEELAGGAAAVAAVALVVLYGPHQLLVASLVSEALVLPVVASFLLLYTHDRWPLAQVLLLGYAYLLRPNLGLFLLLLLGWLLLTDRRRMLRLAPALLFLLPIPALHLATTGSFVATSAEAGPALWMGNHPGSYGLFSNDLGVRGDMHQLASEVIRITRDRTGEELTPAEVNRYWARQVARWAVDDPAAFADNVVLKALRLVDSHEYATDLQWLDDFPSAARLFPVPFALIAALAAAGLPGILRRRYAVELLYLAGAAGSLLIYYPSSRHRYLLLPVLALLAARGLRQLAARRPTAILLAVATLALSLIGVPDERRGKDPMADFNRARAFFAAGEPAQARRFLDRALDEQWPTPFFHLFRAELLEAAGRPAAARRARVAAFLLGASDPGLVNDLAAEALATGRWRWAEEIFRRTLRRFPDNPATQMNLAQALLAQGRTAAARHAYERAVALGSRRRPDMERLLGESTGGG